MPGKSRDATAQLARMFKVGITDLEVSGKVVMVTGQLNRPKPGGIVTAVLAERFAGPVKFDPPAKAK